MIPISTVNRIFCEEVLESAWGIRPNNAAARSIPVAYEIKHGMRTFCTLSGNKRKIAAVIIAPMLPNKLKRIIHSMIIFHHFHIQSNKNLSIVIII